MRWTRIRYLHLAVPMQTILLLFVTALVPISALSDSLGPLGVAISRPRLFASGLLAAAGSIAWMATNFFFGFFAPEPIASNRNMEEWLEKLQKTTDPKTWPETLSSKIEEWHEKNEFNAVLRYAATCLMITSVLLLSGGAMLFLVEVGRSLATIVWHLIMP